MSTRTIWKFVLPIQDTVEINLPSGSTPLHVAEQDGAVCLWVEVTLGAPNEFRKFLVRGTGNPLTGDEGPYLGTAQVGMFVWHVYEAIS